MTRQGQWTRVTPTTRVPKTTLTADAVMVPGRWTERRGGRTVRPQPVREGCGKRGQQVRRWLERRVAGAPKGGVTGQLSQCHDLSPRRRMPAGVKTAGIHRT